MRFRDMRWLEQAARWFRIVLDQRPAWTTTRVAESPEAVVPKVVYLVGESNNPWLAIFVCPCGCEEVISLSLIRNDRPRWRAMLHIDGTVSLSPSIWRKRGCRSHFFIRRGRVVWSYEAPAQ